MILEGIVTTLNEDGVVNIAPMGPKFNGSWDTFVLRPFNTSTTYRNLKRSGEGVLHITDDVLLLARAAIGTVTDAATRDATNVHGKVLLTSSRYYEFRVAEFDDTESRAKIVAKTVAEGRLNECFGLNRAKYAVVEAAILSTRLSLLDHDFIRHEFSRLSPLIEKTGGPDEIEAFRILQAFVEASGAKS
jgi:hypothetical protein